MKYILDISKWMVVIAGGVAVVGAFILGLIWLVLNHPIWFSVVVLFLLANWVREDYQIQSNHYDPQ